ncbi:MAG: PAS domain-containing sensor histidine kinase [Lautropia sp.]
MNRSPRYLAEPTPSYWKSLRYLGDARLIVAAVLLAYVPLIGRQTTLDPAFDRPLFGQFAAAYLVFSVIAACTVRLVPRGFHLQLLASVLVDIAVIGAIVFAAGGARSGLGVLMITPIAGAAILTTPLLSMFVAAIATLVLLGESVGHALADDAGGAIGGNLAIAAVISAVLFCIALVVNRLAHRLAAQERLAARRGEDLRNQLAVNALVIAELDQGVVVLDRHGLPKAMNPKARRLCGLPDGVALDAIDAATGATLRALIASGRTRAELTFGVAGAGQTRAHARVLTAAGDHESAAALLDWVVLLEDLEQLEARAQQLKLASMGRLSASIAHEIRNPLGAIRHAGNLLAEGVAEAQLTRLSRLTAIIEESSLRIDRIVEDVLSLARRSAAREPIVPAEFLSGFLPDFVAQSETSWERIAVVLESDEQPLFDPNHLRQVLVNLLSNALRYASDSPAAIVIAWRAAGAQQAMLTVQDDGPGIPADFRINLFEPFHTTETRGTGLGLHMAQELCVANGARLRYQAAPADGGRYRGAFVIEPELAVRRPSARAASGAPAPVSSGTVPSEAVPSKANPASQEGRWQQKQTA